MRSNTPVTQRRVHIPQDATLMSTTDPDSRVTYANEAFLAVSGFCREELVGEPHNLVRHPDMPEAAFADMWATLRAGLSWSALVKNRSKSGDHYWVRANATPVRRDGRLVGYLSVRTCPGDEEVTQAEAAYQALRGGDAPGMAFHRGLLVHTGWRRWRSWPQTWSTGRRLGLACLLAVAPAAVLAAVLLGGAEALAVLLALGLGWGASSWFLQRQIGGPVRRLRDHALAVAAGSAAEYAMRGKKGVRVFMTSPHGRMSAFQQAQMFSLQDENIHNIAIEGVFDDCQDIVKAVSNDLPFKRKYKIGTVNSINWARLLAQVVYYFAGYVQATERNDQQVSISTSAIQSSKSKL